MILLPYDKQNFFFFVHVLFFFYISFLVLYVNNNNKITIIRSSNKKNHLYCCGVPGMKHERRTYVPGVFVCARGLVLCRRHLFVHSEKMEMQVRT